MLVWWQQLAHARDNCRLSQLRKMASTWAVFISFGVGAVLAGAATTLHATHNTTSTTFLLKNVSTKTDTSKTIYNLSQPLVHETVHLLLPTEEDMPLAEETGDIGSEKPSVSMETGEATTGSPQHPALVVKKEKDPMDISAKEGNIEGERGNNELMDEGDNEGDAEAESRNKEENDRSREAEYEELPVPMAQTVVGYTRDDETYIVNDEDGVACVMAFFKAKVTIYYPDTKGDYLSNRVSPSDDAKVSGTCDRVGKVSQLDVSWSSYVLSLRFGLDDLSDSWFVSSFILSYNLSDPDFTDSAPGGGDVKVMSQDDRRYWQTSNDQSFRCLLLHDVILTDKLNNTATLHFDEVRVQAFCNSDIFRAPKHCIHRVHRDEMVPVTVGAALAGSTLLTVIGYAIFRYFKVKKVQYDTME